MSGTTDHPAMVCAEFVGEIRRAIDAHPLTRSEVAARIGISRSTLARRLAGEHPFYVEELAHVGNLLGVQVSELMRRAEETAAAR